MCNIICFGDSNTYGFRPDGKGQYDKATRWTGRLQTLLGKGYNIVEDGLCGRTTVFDDPDSPNCMGLQALPSCLEYNRPVSMVILMLGTNDCRAIYQPETYKIADGIRQLSEMILNFKNADGSSPKLLIISPIILGQDAWKYEGSYNSRSSVVSQGLAEEYRKVAESLGCDFIDGAEIAGPGSDNQHLNEEGHKQFAECIHKYIISGIPDSHAR